MIADEPRIMVRNLQLFILLTIFYLNIITLKLRVKLSNGVLRCIFQAKHERCFEKRLLKRFGSRGTTCSAQLPLRVLLSKAVVGGFFDK